MTTYNSYFSHRGALSLRLISVLILSGCALWLGLRIPVNHPKTLAPANPLPDLHGQAAVEHLKQKGLYASLAEAMAAARYNADPLPSPDAYQFSNPNHDLRATFTSSGARIASSPGGRERELTIKLIGYGYGSRMTNLDFRNIVARRNRIEHEYSLPKGSAIPESQSAIKEWFVNSDAGIEHGFTLPEPPPTERGGDEALRVEMEIGGDFKPRLDAAGQAVSFACGRRCGGLTYNKLRVYDAREREVAARFELEGKRLAIVVEDGEAEYPVTIDPLFTQKAKLTASGGAAFDEFGFSVAISGDTVVVGAPFATIDNRPAQGAAYIFVRDPTITPTSWTQQEKLTARNGEEFDEFGFSVAIDGDTVVVGALFATIDSNFGHGAAYIFVRDETTWTQQQKLTVSDDASVVSFGVSVSVSGNTVVVGAFCVDSEGFFGPGAAYVFVRDGKTWTLQQKLTASDGESGDFFGGSVAISGDTVVVGAPGDDTYRGAAYVFVSCPEIIINPTDLDLPAGTVGGTYIQPFTASAGTAPLGFTVITGALPPGLNLDTDGTLSGAPTSSGTFNFTVQATDAKGCTGEQAYMLVINSSTCPTITVNPETLPVGTPNLAYDHTLDASGGTAPLSFSVLSGSLPPGLMLSTTGILSGTPTAAGVFNLTVLATDATGCVGARAYTMAIAPSGFATVSAASFEFPVTAKEIVAGFGVSLANKIDFATSTPLPRFLAGTSVRVKDSAGIERPAGLFFISPSQINYQIPAGTALGPATVLVFVGTALVAAGPAQIETTAPSIFTVRANGSGPAAAQDAITYLPAPFNAKQANGEPNIIAVYGTGLGADVTDGGGNIKADVQALIDGKSVMVTYAGQAPGLVGANQFNIQLPDEIESGEHTLMISRDGRPSNLVTIAIREQFDVRRTVSSPGLH